MALNQETDKRMGTSLDDGPPGVDGNDASEKNEEAAVAAASRKSSKSKSTSGRRSTSRRRSNSPPSIRRRSNSPPPPRRRRSHSRSPTPPRGRGRYDSPDYGRYPPRRRFDRRRSPDRDRRRSPPRRGRRDRYGRSRSRSRSGGSPHRRGGGGRGASPASSRWSPKKKPASPPLPAQSALVGQQRMPHSVQSSGYGVMPPAMYSQGPYGPPDVYGHQYGMAPPNAFPPQGPPPGYGMQVPPPAQAGPFNSGYGAWGVNEYGQQVWLPQPLASVPPPVVPEPLVAQQQQVGQQPQQQQQQQQQQQLVSPAIHEDQGTPALESAGLPPQDAVAQEAENQKEELKKQRTNYVKKVSLLKKEMKVLKEQRNDLTAGDAPPSPTTKNFIEENDRLQVQIKKKVDTIENVIDMLNGIIGDEDADEELDETPKKDVELTMLKAIPPSVASGAAASTSSTSGSSESSDSSSSSSSSSDTSTDDDGDEENGTGDGSPTNRLKNRAMKTMKAKQRQAATAAPTKQAVPQAQTCNYVFFDNEQHWCESCSVFPKTARDYLKHLHEEEHMNRETMETPWHVGIDHDPFPAYEKAPVKRVPVRGLQFLVPASAWYCKLCSVWIGDLHCASAHLKSRTHANRYDLFLKKQPNYESDWLSKRERAQQEQKESEEKAKKAKKDEDKTSKKRKKKSSEKKKKKRSKHSKKHKRNSNAAQSTSSSTDSSSSDEAADEQPPKKAHVSTADVAPLIAPANAASIRVTMRKQDVQVAPPPPPFIKDALSTVERSKWTSASNDVKEKEKNEEEKKRDDVMIQQWNTVQPVISESEKKLLEQLKGKLKGKSSRPGDDSKTSTAAADEKPRRPSSKRRSPSPRDRDRDRRDRDRDRGRDRDRERDRDRDRDRRRSRTRSRSRGRRRNSRSPVRGSRRSRSRDARWRRSHSEERVERPVIKHSEFRPRQVPERKQPDSKRDKKDTVAKLKSLKSSSSTAAAISGKKLPFIGKMPVLKKQPLTTPTPVYSDPSAYTNGGTFDALAVGPPPPPPPSMPGVAVRQNAPTAAQIQMAMMEDAFGNAPPFHPDAGMMMDYDELMPDPVQFANLMTHCPPPPPPGESTNADGKVSHKINTDQLNNEDNGEEDVLPPGIDETESDLVPPSMAATTPPRDGELPQDLADALNIIFPTDRPADEVSNDASQLATEPQTITTIVEDEPVMDENNLQDLAKQGIHLVSIEETTSNSIPANEEATKSLESPMQISADEASEGADAYHPPLSNGNGNSKTENSFSPKQLIAEDIPMPCSPPAVASVEEIKSSKADELLNVADIPQPPPSPTNSEKMRRQAELDELAMLGIDTSDMAAQYAL